MPTCLAALMTKVPGAALTAWPSIVRFMSLIVGQLKKVSCEHGLGCMRVRTRTPIQMRLEVFGKLLDNRDSRHGCRIAQRTERTAQHILRELADQRNIALLSAAVMETLQHFFQPGCAFAAGNTPATTLVRIKLHDAQSESDHAGVLIQNHRAARAEHAFHLCQSVEVHWDVALLRFQQRTGRTTQIG